MRIGEEHVALVVHREGRVPHPGDGGGVLDAGEARAVVLDARHRERPALVVLVAREELPLEQVEEPPIVCGPHGLKKRRPSLCGA